MRAIVQRVMRASVTVAGETIGRIDHGMLILLGIHQTDSETHADWLADKIASLRIFQDDLGKMNRSIQDCRGAILVVSQFTLYGDCQKGRRPSFLQSASPEKAEPLYQYFTDRLRLNGIPVATGKFGADMAVELVNDGPVTLIIDSPV